MYLKALKLHGFKSFADATQLHFEPGVTAVVGPNGCGKSNIADAIRWVLGEQSAKALRGGKMQDVIFEGTDGRKPSQLCEVALLLTECEKQLGSEFHEIEIMRRVHRDGQSEYFFNGQACRLRDIHKLFMDTGIGRTSYSIMAQGQIDQILSSKPEERRAVFEEAAGITKYKSQRKEALNKLALTEQNLARVSDVIAEVGRQIGSLKRQAAKAMRYRRLNHRLRHLSLAWACHQHAALKVELAELDAQVAQLRTAADNRRQGLESRQSDVDERKRRRTESLQRLQDKQQEEYNLRSRREAAENAAQVATIRRNGLEERLAGARDSAGELEMQLREVTARADTGAQDRQMQLGLLGSSDAVFQQRNRELGLAEGELKRLEQALEQARFALLQSESAVARLRTECSAHEVEQKTAVHRHDLLAGELDGVRGQLADADGARAEQEGRVREAAERKAAAGRAAQEQQQVIAALTGEFREAQRQLQGIDREIAQRSARLKLLRQLQEDWEGFGEGAKAVLQGRLGETLDGGTVVPLMQGLDVQSALGRAIEALLGSAAQAIVVSDVDLARRIIDRLESDQVGEAVLQVGRGTPGGQPAVLLPPGLRPAVTALQGLPENHPVAALLAECYVAEDLGGFLDFWKANPGFRFLAVATPKGEVVDGRGLISGGYRDEDQRSPGIVQREIDLRETSRVLAEDQDRHERQKTAIDALGVRLQEAESALEERRGEVLSATQAEAALEAERQNLARNHQGLAERVRRMESEHSALERARDEAHARWEKARGDLETAEAAVVRGRNELSSLERQIAECRATRDTKKESLGQARLDLAEHRQKVELLDRGLGEMEQRRREIEDLLQQRQEEIEEWNSQLGGLAAEAEAGRAQAEGLVGAIDAAREEVASIRVALSALETEIAEIESAQAGIRREADAAQEELNAGMVKLAEVRQRLTFLEEDTTREYQAELATLDWRHLIWRADDEPEGLHPLDLEEEGEEAEPRRRRRKEPKGEPGEEDLAALALTEWESVRGDIEVLRQRIGGMGAVNLVAIEEYADLKQRFDFLQGQSNDLRSAKDELLRMIDEINQTSLRQFEVTFEQIRKNFAYTFQTLFGGGRAALELIEAEDILESGIEIVAQPPGTRLKGISLLSGGQKTLTAVALLFALYMVKPSPFCLLDELDAPLDESNIGRFTELLKKFVAESQFLIITHNKRTVASANAIYGVTMEERGVSKTVSMRFNHERGEAESHPQNVAEAVGSAGVGA